MVNLSVETVVSLRDAAKQFPGGCEVCYETIRRWATAGIRGVKLETVRLGGRRMTSLEACSRFVELLTERDDPQRASAARRERADAAMERMRAKHGVK